MNRVRVEIDHVTFDGYTPAQRRQFLAGLHTALGQLQEISPASWRQAGSQRLPRVDAGAPPAAASADLAGRQVVRQLRREIAGGGGRPR